MSSRRKTFAGRRRGWLITGAAGIVLLAVLLPQVLAERLGGWLARVLVGSLELVLGVLAPLFGG